MATPLTVGIVQEGPVHQDKAASMARLAEIIKEAAAEQVQLLTFGESWLSGYPAWFDHVPGAALWDTDEGKAVYQRMHQNAITVPGPETKQIGAWAQIHQMVIVIGANEKVEEGSHHGSLFNSLLIFNEAGELAVHHRKLMPTYTEKLVHAPGDGAGLQSIKASFGRVGGLICWEHWMPLTRQAMHDAGEHVHVALWPNVLEKHRLASQHYAFEGRCYVVAVGQLMKASDLPSEWPLPDTFNGDHEAPVLRGGSCIYGPDGELEMEPVLDRGGILIYTIEDLDRTIGERMNLDVSGHYQRPDVFSLKVNRDRP